MENTFYEKHIVRKSLLGIIFLCYLIGHVITACLTGATKISIWLKPLIPKKLSSENLSNSPLK